MLFTFLLIWILPRFPAQPKLGPVYYPVTAFVPPDVPLLLIAPAIAIDLLRNWFDRRSVNAWFQAALCGAAFMGIFLAVQWPFSAFIISRAAANPFFGTIYHDYSARPQSFQVLGLFVPHETHFGPMLALAVAIAVITTRIGMAWGNWMRTVKR